MIDYVRNPFRGIPDMTDEEKSWDILYERYCSQQDLGICKDLFVYCIPTVTDATKYTLLKKDMDKHTHDIQSITTIDVVEKIFMIRSLTTAFEESVMRIASHALNNET